MSLKNNIMKNNTKIGLIFIAVFAMVFIRGCAKDSCGDGICQVGEEKRGSCPEDCDSAKVFPDTRWTYQDLPALTNQQRLNLAVEAKKEGDAYSEQVIMEAEELSRELEDYIRKWLDGKVDAELPKGLLPPYIDSVKTHDWKLVNPDEITAEEQWYAMNMYDPQEELHQHAVDPHVTYLKLIFIAPFGSKLLIEGDFPHCRFMDYQILEPLDPGHPVTGNMGVGEVAIVDADIEPDEGHVNPFRLGADRNAKKRHYHITFELKKGNAVDLNPEAMIAPAYRAKGNTRVGGPFGFAGPWGGNELVPSIVWLRYYAPDKDAEPYGNVPWPKATLQLSTGEKFWLTCDKSKAVKDQTATVPQRPTPPIEPSNFQGSNFGWFKMYGISLLYAEADTFNKLTPWDSEEEIEKMKKNLRDIFQLLFNRGADAVPPGNYEVSATCCNYISYLIRPISLGKNKVIVLTGKLPTFPGTRNGEEEMTSGEVRYFSITHLQGGGGLGTTLYTGVPHGSLMDDEIITNEDGEYVIVFSREQDRPKNAIKKNNITWQDWGPAGRQNLNLRWLSVRPEWYLPEYAPDEKNIPWDKGSWSGQNYDFSLVGQNRPGVMGPYHPVIHYMTKEEFEALGSNIDPNDVPDWNKNNE